MPFSFKPHLREKIPKSITIERVKFFKIPQPEKKNTIRFALHPFCIFFTGIALKVNIFISVL